LFAHPRDIRRAAETSLTDGQNPLAMRQRPGEIMRCLAYAHPFLDGNGRTIMVVHAVLSQRAGFSINWAATSKNDYLTALTKEIDEPGKGLLDEYLKPFIRSEITDKELVEHVRNMSALRGTPLAQPEGDAVLGRVEEPAVAERYRQQSARRAATKRRD
jgi:cell filamentation protein